MLNLLGVSWIVQSWVGSLVLVSNERPYCYIDAYIPGNIWSLHFNKVFGPQYTLLEGTNKYQQEIYLDHMGLPD